MCVFARHTRHLNEKQINIAYLVEFILLREDKSFVALCGAMRCRQGREIPEITSTYPPIANHHPPVPILFSTLFLLFIVPIVLRFLSTYSSHIAVP